jgi:hypothetical protein
MLEAQIREEDVAGIRQLSDAAQFASQLLTADSFRHEFESGACKRKAFCEALDIGESTLSTWLQTGRIPRVAAVAYVLWLFLKKLGNEIRQRDESAAEPYVVRCRDGYAVVQPADRASPDAIHQVIASGIETVELAQQIAVARSRRYRAVLDRSLDALSAYEEQYDKEDNWVAETIFDLKRARDFKIGPVTADEL